MSQSPGKSSHELDLCDMSPAALYCSYFMSSAFTKGTRLGKRFVYDYEIEYIAEGDEDGLIILNGQEYPVRQGDIIFRRPGWQVEGIMPYSGYTLCFDPSGKVRISPEAYWDTRQRSFLPAYANKVLDEIPPLFHSTDETLLSLFQSAYHEFIYPGLLSPLVQKSNILCILYQVYKDIQTGSSSTGFYASAYYARLKRVVEYIGLNYHKTLTLKELARLAALSPTYFHAIFVRAMGKTPNEYIAEIRVNKAKELLLNTNLRISDIAEKCGFDNASYFTSVFKKRSQLNPSAFRETNHSSRPSAY